MKRETPIGVVIAALALVAMVALPFLAPIMDERAARSEAEAARLESAGERSGAVADGVEVPRPAAPARP